jgi:hypothetical protein
MNDPRLEHFSSSLTATTNAGDDLIRFRESDGDNQVAAKVQVSELYDDDARAQLRAGLSDDAQEVLQLFARRRVVLGRRTSNQSHFHQALSAFSLLPSINDVPWTTWFLGALLLGDDALDQDVVALFGDPSSPGARRCRTLQQSLRNGGSLAGCHLVEVSTTYGIGMFELPRPRDFPGRGSRPPVIGRDDAVYAPQRNLAQVAVDLADSLDRLEGTHTTALDYAPLATGPSVYVSSVGCLHCCWITENSVFDVYVAGVTTDHEASRLVEDASSNGFLAFSQGPEVVLYVRQPNFEDDGPQAPADTKMLEALSREALSHS